MPRTSPRRRALVLGAIIAAIIFAAAVLLYFLFDEHFASALIGVAGLAIAVATLIVAVVGLFNQPSSASDSPSAATAQNDPYSYQKPKFPMTPMRRPREHNASPTLDDSSGQKP